MASAAINDKTAYLLSFISSINKCKELLPEPVPLCLSVCSMYKSWATHPTDLKCCICLANDPSECSAKFCGCWTNNTTDITKRDTVTFHTQSAVAIPCLTCIWCSRPTEPAWRKKLDNYSMLSSQSSFALKCTSYHSGELWCYHLSDIHIVWSLHIMQQHASTRKLKSKQSVKI